LWHQQIGTKIADDYPEIRRRRGNLLYVLLGLPGGGRSSGAAHQVWAYLLCSIVLKYSWLTVAFQWGII
jgi:hypothetical protein